MVFKIEENSRKYSSFGVRPVFSVINEVVFAINREQEWVKVTPLGTEYFDITSYDASLLTLLEEPHNKLRSEIINSLAVSHLSKALANDFPFYLVVLNGLRSGSDYWIQLALDWISSEKSLVKDEALNMLRLIPTDKSYSQKVRHRVMKINKNLVK